MNIINLTHHDVNVINDSNEVISYKPSGHVARVPFNQEVHGQIDNITVYKKIYGEISFGTEIKAYNIYIVSVEVMRALTDQIHPLIHQFVSPNTLKAVRDGNGNITKVTGFSI